MRISIASFRDMKKFLFAIMFLWVWVASAAPGAYTLSVNSNGLIVAPVTPSQFGTANGFGSGSTNIPLSFLTQSGASVGQFIEWNGSQWVPATASGTGTLTNVAASTIGSNAFGLGAVISGPTAVLTLMTNTNSSSGGVSSVNSLTGAVAGVAISDTRSITNFTPGQVPLQPANTLPFVIMTNNGPGTVQSIHFTIAGATNQATIPNSILSIFADGRSNGMTLANLYDASWQPFARHNGRLDFSWNISGGPYIGLTCYRKHDLDPINAWTNFGINLAMPSQTGGMIVYFDIYAAIGTPPPTGGPNQYWNCGEVNVNAVNGQSFGVTNIGKSGKLVSIMYGFVSTNLGDFGNIVYYNLDGTNVLTAGGIDDMGNSGYEGWAQNNLIGGWDQVDTINYGASYFSWLSALYSISPLTNGIEMFRYYDNAYFTNHLDVHMTFGGNGVGAVMSNRLAATWMSGY